MVLNQKNSSLPGHLVVGYIFLVMHLYIMAKLYSEVLILVKLYSFQNFASTI